MATIYTSIFRPQELHPTMEVAKSPARRACSRRRRVSFAGRTVSTSGKKGSSTPAHERFYRSRQSYRQRLEMSKRRTAFLRSYQLSVHPTRRQAMAGIVKRLQKLVEKLRSAAASFSGCYRRHPTTTSTTTTLGSIDRCRSNM